MKNETKVKIISATIAGAVFALFGIDNTLTLKDYIVRSDKIKKPVSIIFLSDIHSQKFKDGGKNLLNMINASKPDFIFFGGDIFDKYAKEKEIEKAKELVMQIANQNKNCYYVLGNHEVDCKLGIDFKDFLSDTGINFFNGSSYELTAGSGQKILVGGVDFIAGDSCAKETCDALEQIEQKNELIRRTEETGLFSVLLRHVPMKTEGDEKIDLILSGHNHGGLWRFPNTNAGVAGGGTKFFPRYVHGEYKNGDSTMIVGSGIVTETYLLPRLYNVPEVVSIVLLPKTNLPY